MHIGKGIQLDNKEDQMHIMITNNSDMPVFVQSKNTNLMMNMPLVKVCRIPPHSQLCVFEFNLFFQVRFLKFKIIFMLFFNNCQKLRCWNSRATIAMD